MSKVSRRRFLTVAIGVGGALGMGMLGIDGQGVLAGDVGDCRSLVKVSRRGWALGASVELTVLCQEKSQGEVAIDRAFAELRRMDQLMSLYRDDSEVSRLNRDGVLVHPSTDVYEVMWYGKELARRTDGAFDLTVQPLWDVFAGAKLKDRLPDEVAVAKARKLVDWRKVSVERDAIRLKRAGMAVTLNGIAQGYAADQVMKVLQEAGIEHALVNTGEVGGIGEKGEGEKWRVGINEPRGEGLLAEVDLKGRCLATSGDYETRFTEDYEHHHIFDPRTGWSPYELSSVTVAAGSTLEADALSTAVFVMGIEKGKQLIESVKRADVMMVSKSGDVVMTGGFAG